MAVIGKIICEDPLRIYGFVEGEVIASNALIADGAQIQGDIVAEELTVAGRVKGNIYALRVKLQASAVVEGDIFHRLLSIDEHAWFEGCSRPDQNPPEPRSSIKAESSTPEPRQQALVAFDDQGEFKTDFTDEESTPLRRSGMRAFLVACIAIMAIGVMGHFALSALQQATGLAYTTDNVRIDPGMERSTQLGWTEPLPGPETAVRASIPETSQTATIVQTVPDTVAPKAGTAVLDPGQVSQTPQSLAAPLQTATVATAPDAVAPKAGTALLEPEQVSQTPQSLAAPLQTATVATAPDAVAPKAGTALLEPEQVSQTPQSLAAPLQTATVATAPDAVAPKTDAPFLDQERVPQTPQSRAAVEQPDVEILAKIPVPRPRPTATPARRSMLVLPRSARAPMTPPSSRTPIPPH
jgi:cytoskeletal protein CcmA (bactofilin family)